MKFSAQTRLQILYFGEFYKDNRHYNAEQHISGPKGGTVSSVGWQITLSDPIDKWRPVVLR